VTFKVINRVKAKLQYDMHSQDMQSLPLMKSSYSCEQDIDGRSRLLTKSECTETHSFRPFTNGQSGASTEVRYKLTFRREIDGTSPADGLSVCLLYSFWLKTNTYYVAINFVVNDTSSSN